jgi:hypothetical protein
LRLLHTAHRLLLLPLTAYYFYRLPHTAYRLQTLLTKKLETKIYMSLILTIIKVILYQKEKILKKPNGYIFTNKIIVSLLYN